MRTIEEVIAELRNDIHSDVYLGKKTINTYLDEILEIHKAERPTGHWIDTGMQEEYWAEEYQCSICGAKDHWHNYCPNCGADMRSKGGRE